MPLTVSQQIEILELVKQYIEDHDTAKEVAMRLIEILTDEEVA